MRKETPGTAGATAAVKVTEALDDDDDAAAAAATLLLFSKETTAQCVAVLLSFTGN